MFRLSTLLLATCAGILTLPVLAAPPEWAPAHGQREKEGREYRYVYYPAQQIYYSTEQQIWFWINGSSWSLGVNLPAHFRAQIGSGLAVILPTPRPYAEHAYVEQRYGRPWRARHDRQGAAKEVQKRRLYEDRDSSG